MANEEEPKKARLAEQTSTEKTREYEMDGFIAAVIITNVGKGFSDRNLREECKKGDREMMG